MSVIQIGVNFIFYRNYFFVYLSMINIKRESKYETVYHPNMGRLTVMVTRIYKCIMGFKTKKLYEYRETYFGEVKETKNCVLSKV